MLHFSGSGDIPYFEKTFPNQIISGFPRSHFFGLRVKPFFRNTDKAWSRKNFMLLDFSMNYDIILNVDDILAGLYYLSDLLLDFTAGRASTHHHALISINAPWCSERIQFSGRLLYFKLIITICHVQF